MNRFSFSVFFLTLLSFTCFAQDKVVSTKTSDSGKSIGIVRQIGEVSREKREQAYAKLLEGQRYLWELARYDSDPRVTTPTPSKLRRERMAKTAFQKAVELNPRLAEGYTALAELALVSERGNIEEAIMLARIAVRLDKDNFGSHLYLARLYTIKSNIGRGKLNNSIARDAIKQWEIIGKLDPRNAEAQAFLSVFFEETKQPEKRIEALRKWGSAAAPVERGFFARVIRRGEDISPENAVTKLGQALLEAGKDEEALKILNQAVVDNPRQPIAVELLKNALENADDKDLSPSVVALRQAAFANPDSNAIVVLLAQTIARTGEIDSAAKVLENAVAKSDKKTSASDLQVAVGDIYADSRQVTKAINAYEKALKIRGVEKNTLVAAVNKEFAVRVFSKMIQALKRAKRIDEAKLLIENSRPIFGNESLDLIKEQINLLRETGNQEEALVAVKAARRGAPKDISLIRSEASILTKFGRVEDGVRLIENLIQNKPGGEGSSMLYDDFSNYLFISSLYTEAKRKDEAIFSLNRALDISDGVEKKQIARLNLAFVHSSFDETDVAEKILRLILQESPEYPLALNNLGYLLLKQDKNLDEALVLIKKAVRIEPQNSSYLDSLGWVYFKLGKYDQAENFLRKAFRFNPSSVTILEHLGDVYKKRGKDREAKAIWERALSYTSKTEEVERIRMKLSRE